MRALWLIHTQRPFNWQPKLEFAFISEQGTPENPFSFSKFVKPNVQASSVVNDLPEFGHTANTQDTTDESLHSYEAAITNSHSSPHSSSIIADRLYNEVHQDRVTDSNKLAKEALLTSNIPLDTPYLSDPMLTSLNVDSNGIDIVTEQSDLNDSFESLASSDFDDFSPRTKNCSSKVILDDTEDSFKTVILEDLHGLTKQELIRKIEHVGICLTISWPCYLAAWNAVFKTCNRLYSYNIGFRYTIYIIYMLQLREKNEVLVTQLRTSDENNETHLQKYDTL